MSTKNAMNIMKAIAVCLFSVIILVESNEYLNVTYQPAHRQLLDFKKEHPYPIGLWTKNAGDPVEIRDTTTINSDVFNNQLFIDTFSTFDGERIPERVVHARGTGAFGYFEVTHDVSKYTSADVFNGVGKKTPLVARFSNALQGLGGTDFPREHRGMSVKFYTKEGNLDLLCLSIPVYFYRDPIFFKHLLHAFTRNPQTTLFNPTSVFDFITLRPAFIHGFFWVMSDFGIPDGYRKMDAFPIHTYEVSNKHGETHYVRFNFRTEQGVAILTNEEAAALQSQDLEYFNRDLYNAINSGEYPAWKLEMDVMTPHDIQRVDYDPFDVTRLWKNGTFFTVPIGRMVLNKNVENNFRDIEQAAFNPGHLVPGITGSPEGLFRGRRMFYRDTQNYRLGRNHNNILVNMPLYSKTYARDGKPPTRLNMKNAPNYFPNSFNGPLPCVDEQRPWKKLQVLESNAVDLEPAWYFYNFILEDDAHRQRFINTWAAALVPVTPPVLQRTLKLLHQVDNDLGMRVAVTHEILLARAMAQQAAARAASAVPRPKRNLITSEGPPEHDNMGSVYKIEL
ncbi:peroxisomal catalase 1-like [Spodoptera frugiperda]|uniref:Peroxisomal catalase 1-like n=1 Tax=Spodoptera frugiperda TaxID=7108 RepID=A0A9R0DEB2_SPOFR|nr:peroxisomal catalase 1-like [Spodoptera frugiperda]